jgi:outer membrane protein assembly factor BamB
MIAGDSLLVGERRGYLFSLDTATGEINWWFKTGNAIHSSPLVTEDTIYFGSNDGHFYALERV